MSDKYTLQLKNFRSIRDAEIDIAPLTVVYGPERIRQIVADLRPADAQEFSDRPKPKPAGAVLLSGYKFGWL